MAEHLSAKDNRYSFHAYPVGAQGDLIVSLRNRCTALYQKMQQDAMFRQGSAVDDLMTFVIAEQGRAVDTSLAETLPLCLYFGSDRDREEIIALIHDVKPNTIAKRMP